VPWDFDELGREYFETFALESGNYLAYKSAMDCVGLCHYKGALNRHNTTLSNGNRKNGYMVCRSMRSEATYVIVTYEGD
jgi:hypothetical protein